MDTMKKTQAPAEIRYPAGFVADTKYGRNAIYPEARPTCECGFNHPRNYVCKESA